EYCKNTILMDAGTIIWKKSVREGLTRVNELKSKNIFPPQVTQAANLLSENEGVTLPIHLEEAVNYFEEYNLPQIKPIRLQQPLDPQNRTEKEKIVAIKEAEFSYKMISRQKKK